MTSLADASDTLLDDELLELYAIHAAATDPDERADAHASIAAILGEQSRRLDAWLEEHLKEPVQ